MPRYSINKIANSDNWFHIQEKSNDPVYKDCDWSHKELIENLSAGSPYDVWSNTSNTNFIVHVHN